MKSSNSITNQAIADKFGEELASGHVVVVAHMHSSVKGAVRLELAQRRSLGSGNRAPRSRFQADFSVGELPIARAWHSVSTADMKASFNVGDMVMNMRLAVRDQLTPAYAGHTPRVTKEGTLLVSEDGLPVYREIVPAYVDEDYSDYIIPVTDSGDAWESEEEGEE